MGDHEGQCCALKSSQSNPVRIPITNELSLVPPSQGILCVQELNSQTFCVLS